MISEHLLATLRDCSISTERGFVDKGNPNKLLRLSLLGFVIAKDGGYQVTEEGRLYLKTHKKDLLKL